VSDIDNGQLPPLSPQTGAQDPATTTPVPSVAAPGGPLPVFPAAPVTAPPEPAPVPDERVEEPGSDGDPSRGGLPHSRRE